MRLCGLESPADPSSRGISPDDVLIGDLIDRNSYALQLVED
jgi:hypothetical protein